MATTQPVRGKASVPATRGRPPPSQAAGPRAPHTLPAGAAVLGEDCVGGEGGAHGLDDDGLGGAVCVADEVHAALAAAPR